jgi:hypothetical protein
MGEIPLKVLVIDSDSRAARALADALRKVESVIKVDVCATIPDAANILTKLDINVIYIDPVDLGIDEASDFIFQIRKQYPAIVFVLYTDTESLKLQENLFYSGKRSRFRHYFMLGKVGFGREFVGEVRGTVTACQGDLSFNLTQYKIAELQSELRDIQKSTSSDNAIVPIALLHEIQEQLSALKNERQSPGILHGAAKFLGPVAPSVKTNRCFIIMPYSQDWSEAVEAIIRETCQATGFEFSIAKEMDGRFIPHDIWEGITGSAIMIADLTGANANVAYEIGLADAIGRKIILICQDIKVPFDFLAQRLIVYKNTVQGSLDLRRNLAEQLDRIKQSN